MCVCARTHGLWYTPFVLTGWFQVSIYFSLPPHFLAIDPNLAGSPQERTHWSEGKRLQFTLFGPAIKYTFLAEHISGLKKCQPIV